MDTVLGMADDAKRCPRCKETKPIATDWYVIKKGPKAGRALGYCRTCTAEKGVLYRGGDLEEHRRRVERKEKRCPRCKEVKPIETGFYILKSGPREGRISGYCRACDVEITAIAFGRTPGAYRATQQRNAEWSAANPGKMPRHVRASMLRRYGLTMEQYDAMLARQGGICAACSRPETRRINGIVTRLAVDHCHATGKVRGLLCANCNTAVGHLRDDPQAAYGVARYLERAATEEDEADEEAS